MPMEEIADEFRRGPASAAVNHFDCAGRHIRLTGRETGLDNRHAASEGAGCRNRP